MSFFPDGLSMAVEYERSHAAQLAIYGEAAIWTPAGGFPIAVMVVKGSPSELSAAGVLAVLFGSLASSGFTSMPAKNDIFSINSTNYRAFEVQGPDATGGLWIHLTK